MKKFLLIFIFAISCKYNNETAYLFPDINLNNIEKETVKLSEIFNDNYRLIQPEMPADSSILEGRGKIVKLDGIFYMVSNNCIYVYDSYGKYISKLGKQGRANNEYSRISDFNIVKNDSDNIEIWISDDNTIYKYNSLDGKFISRIDFDFVICKFKVNEDRMLITVRDDKMLALCDLNGNIIQMYLDYDSANSSIKIMQFRIINNEFVYQIGDTNSYLSINCDGTSSINTIFCDDNNLVITEDESRNYYKQYGDIESSRKINELFLSIYTFGSVIDNSFVVFTSKKSRLFAYKTKGSDFKVYNYYGSDRSEIINDITGGDNLNFLATCGSSDSDESLLFAMGPNEVQENFKVKINTSENKYTYKTISENDNFLIMEIL